MLCKNQSLFSPLIPLKAFLEIDYTESLPLLWITVQLYSSNLFFFSIQRYGHLFYYATRCKSWSLNIRDHPFLRIILCWDSRTSVRVLGIALLSQISVIVLVILFSRSVFSHQHQNACFMKSENNPAEWFEAVFNSLLCCFFSKQPW